MFEQIPREKLEEYYKSMQLVAFWSGMPAPEQAFKSFIGNLITAGENSEEQKAAKAFTTAHANSLYCEYAMPFAKK